MKKVMTILGTRPEIIKLSSTINELDRYTNHTLVHTGQNYDYELNQIFFEDLGIRKPDYFMEAAGKNAAETIANVIIKADEIIEKINPDALLIYGDTNSCISALSAKKRQIPIFHMEAGNRCFDQRVPEEVNRKVIDHLSDVNMTITEHARRYLLSEGLRPELTFKVGSSMKEVIEGIGSKIHESKILDKLKIKAKNYFVVSLHREENVDNEIEFSEFLKSLNLISKEFNKKIIVSTHPRTRKKLDLQKDFEFRSNIDFLKPMGFTDYLKLQTSAFCTLSDSGTITEEASLLGFPAVTIRNAHERPEGMDEGTLIMCGLKAKNIINAVKIVTAQNDSVFPSEVTDYAVKNVSKKVLRIIISYIDYVNENIWKK